MMIFRMSRYVRTCTHGKKLLVFVYVALVAGATAEQKLVGSCTVEAGNVRTCTCTSTKYNGQRQF